MAQDNELGADIADVQSAMAGMETRVKDEIASLKAAGVSAENLAGLKAIAKELGSFETPTSEPAATATDTSAS